VIPNCGARGVRPHLPYPRNGPSCKLRADMLKGLHEVPWAALQCCHAVGVSEPWPRDWLRSLTFISDKLHLLCDTESVFRLLFYYAVSKHGYLEHNTTEQSGQRLGYERDDRSSIPGRGRYFLSFATTSRPALVPTKPAIQGAPRALSPGERRSGHEADHSPPSSTEVKNAWSYTSTPQWRGA
jgi:hypothetical protein